MDEDVDEDMDEETGMVDRSKRGQPEGTGCRM